MAIGRNSVTEPLASTVPSPSPATSQNWSRTFGCHQYCKLNIFTLLLWNFLVGCAFTYIILVPVDNYLNLNLRKFTAHFTLGAYGVLGIVQILYPISGFLADVRYGRYKIIISSILIIWSGFFFLCLAGVIYAIRGTANSTIKSAELVMAVVGLIAFIIGFSGFRSNSIQFSLDQLLDASSEKISLFLHWFVWTESIGEMVVRLLDACLSRYLIAGFASIIFLTLSTIFVLLAYFTHNSFYREKISSNPYWNVWKVLRFAAKHDKPLHYRSAFTYSDDEKPPRIDFAKRIYGGPFETEVVENVKTFVRIVFMLLATTPVFLLDVPTSYLFTLFGLQFRKDISLCNYEWMLFESGNLSTITSVVAIPVYLLLLYPFIKKWVPKIITRLGIGIMLMVATVVSMCIIQAVANYTAFQNVSNYTLFQNDSTCFFLRQL